MLSTIERGVLGSSLFISTKVVKDLREIVSLFFVLFT